jgi:hypothetical protein
MKTDSRSEPGSEPKAKKKIPPRSARPFRTPWRNGSLRPEPPSLGEVNKETAEKVISRLLLLESQSDDPVRVLIMIPRRGCGRGLCHIDMVRFVKPEV